MSVNFPTLGDDVRAIHGGGIWCVRATMIGCFLVMFLLVECILLHQTATREDHKRYQDLCVQTNATEAWCEASWELLRDMTGSKGNESLSWVFWVCVAILLIQACVIPLMWNRVERSFGALLFTTIATGVYVVQDILFGSNAKQEQKEIE